MAKTPDAVAQPLDYVRSQAQAADRPPLQHIRQQRFVPQAFAGEPPDAPHNAVITVDLGGERMRCIVRKAVDEDTVILEITGVPMARNHTHKQGDFVGARRQRGLHGGDEWKAVNERVVNEIEQRGLVEERQARLEAKSPAAKPVTRRGGR
ncbi:MAG: hypothetical protein ACLQJR_09965 [Stellaceae bacterium]